MMMSWVKGGTGDGDGDEEGVGGREGRRFGDLKLDLHWLFWMKIDIGLIHNYKTFYLHSDLLHFGIVSTGSGPPHANASLGPVPSLLPP